MNREIKFRGRIAEGLENAGCWVYWGINGTDMLDALDYSTIGELTGLKDKNEKEIYEGDILLDGEILYLVSWRQDVFGFSIKGTDKRFKVDQAFAFASQVKREAKVIGNVWENPELVAP